jgi:hypothetical protein
LGTVEAHPAGACEVMALSGAVHCAGASNGGLLVPGACARVFLLVRACIFALKCLTRLRRARQLSARLEAQPVRKQC